MDALELVQGGYGTTLIEPSQTPHDQADLGDTAVAPDIALEFTPRGVAGQGRGPTQRRRLARACNSTSRFALAGPTPSSASAWHLARCPSGQFDPGAYRADRRRCYALVRLSVGGGLGRAPGARRERRPDGGHLGLWPDHGGAGLWPIRIDRGPGLQEVLMLSTDLAVWSWLTLESDLALGSRSSTVDGERDRNRGAGGGRPSGCA